MASSWFSYLNPIPSFPEYPGPCNVGTVDVELPVSELQNLFTRSYPIPDSSISTVAFRVFYPCVQQKGPGKPVRWLPEPQRKVVSAYVQFGGVGPGVSNLFSYFPQPLTFITIPAHDHAPLAPPKDPSTQWPVCIFSHGLGSNRNVYSYLCGSLASHGMVVVAAEHRDGSAPVSFIRNKDTGVQEPVMYRRISHTASPEVYAARDEQLRIRCWELSLIHQALLSINNGDPITNLAEPKTRPSKRNTAAESILSTFRSNLDVQIPGRITWAGHSMGAATIVAFLKSTFYHNSDNSNDNASDHTSPPSSKPTDPIFSPRPSAPIVEQITPSSPIILLDLWTLPLQSPSTRNLRDLPMPCFSPRGPGGGAVLAVLSEAFAIWKGNFERVKATLADPEAERQRQRQPARMFYPVRSAHLSQSDFGLLFPRVVKYFAKAEEPRRTMGLNVRAVVEVLRQAGIGVVPDEKDEEILDDGGKIEGWVALHEKYDAAGAIARHGGGGSGSGEERIAVEAFGDNELNAARSETKEKL